MKIITGSVNGFVKVMQLETKKVLGRVKIGAGGSAVACLTWAPQLDASLSVPDAVFAVTAAGEIAVVGVSGETPVVHGSASLPRRVVATGVPVYARRVGDKGHVLIVTAGGHVGILDVAGRENSKLPAGSVVGDVVISSPMGKDGYADVLSVRGPVAAVDIGLDPEGRPLLATGGEWNTVQVTDLSVEGGEKIWRAQNPPPHCQTRIPPGIWPTGVAWIPARPGVLAEVSSYGYVRLYDTNVVDDGEGHSEETEEEREDRLFATLRETGKHPRQPLMEVAEETSFRTCIAVGGAGTTFIAACKRGSVAKYKMEEEKQRIRPLGKFRGGIAGAIRAVDTHKGGLPLMAAGGLDRYVHVFDIRSRKPILKVYNKSKISALLFSPEGIIKPKKKSRAAADGPPSGPSGPSGQEKVAKKEKKEVVEEEYEYYYEDEEDVEQEKDAKVMETTLQALDETIPNPDATKHADNLLWDDLDQAEDYDDDEEESEDESEDEEERKRAGKRSKVLDGSSSRKTRATTSTSAGSRRGLHSDDSESEDEAAGKKRKSTSKQKQKTKPKAKPKTKQRGTRRGS